MSHLIRIRQRLSAITTIKKITSAMRLIACSVTGQLQNRLTFFNAYHNEVKGLLHLISTEAKYVSKMGTAQAEGRTLYICLGSQKGLCGSFNSQLSYWFFKNRVLLTNPSIVLMAVGKMTADFMRRKGYHVAHTFSSLTVQSSSHLAHEISAYLKSIKVPYARVVIVSNRVRNFFSHELTETQIVPLIYTTAQIIDDSPEPFTFEQDSTMIYEQLLDHYSYNQTYFLLLNSLLAEQNARFIAMDNATRNANQFLENMKRQYNKLRQAKITKELTELSAHFQQ